MFTLIDSKMSEQANVSLETENASSIQEQDQDKSIPTGMHLF